MDINEMEQQIYSTEGYKIDSIMRGLDMSVQIFKRNYQQFSELIKSFDNPAYVMFFWAEGIESEKMRIDFQIEAHRAFTNFEASAASLIDHSRRFSESNIKDTIKEKYINKKNEYFVKNKLASFVKDLRNYLLHREYPNIEISYHFHNEKNEYEFTMSKAELIGWSGWKSVSKDFIAEQSEKISVASIVDNYYNLVVEFYGWFFDELRIEYKEEYAEVNKLIEKFNKTFFGNGKIGTPANFV